MNGRDIVTKLPAFLGFREVGQLIYIDLTKRVSYYDEAVKTRERDRAKDFETLFDFFLPKQEASKIPMVFAKNTSITPSDQINSGALPNPRRHTVDFADWMRSILNNNPLLRMITFPILLFARYLYFSLFSQCVSVVSLACK